MKAHHIPITKTARYFTLGEVTEATTHLWIVCHGYAQLANYFLKNFEAINNGKHVIVAPEGLHRFYWQGFSGKVVASWMTKEDRLNDIKDYVHFLDAVYEQYTQQHPHLKVVVLGFSQGVATASRWIQQGKVKANHFVLWAGVFPPDMNFEVDETVLHQTQNWLVLGTEDEFINEETLQQQEQILAHHRIQYQVLKFEGKHVIHGPTLQQLANQLE